jgi:hypothetical protein
MLMAACRKRRIARLPEDDIPRPVVRVERSRQAIEQALPGSVGLPRRSKPLVVVPSTAMVVMMKMHRTTMTDAPGRNRTPYG